jgi:hypothetical protein
MRWFLTNRTHLVLNCLLMVLIVAGAIVYNASRAEAKVDTNSPLLVTTRTSLRLCAHVAPSLADQSAEIRERLSTSLNIVRTTNPYWGKAYRDAALPQLETACTIQIPEQPIDESDPYAVGRGMVKDPSPYRAVFLILDEATAKNILGERLASLVPYEMMQVGDHDAAEITKALVLRESAIDNPKVIQLQMALAIGLYPAQPIELPPGEKSPTIKPEGHDNP